MNVTRACLADAAALRLRTISTAESRRLVDQVLEEITGALARGESVKISGFGTFEPHSKGGRIGRNPKTGQEATISPRRVVRFKASPLLRAAVDGGPN